MSFTEVADAGAADTGAAAAISEERLSTEEVPQRAVGGAAIDVQSQAPRSMCSRARQSLPLASWARLVSAHLVTPSELDTAARSMLSGRRRVPSPVRRLESAHSAHSQHPV